MSPPGIFSVILRSEIMNLKENKSGQVCFQQQSAAQCWQSRGDGSPSVGSDRSCVTEGKTGKTGETNKK